MRCRTWGELIFKLHKPKSVIGMPIRINGKTCIIKAFHKDYVEVIECNPNLMRWRRDES